MVEKKQGLKPDIVLKNYWDDNERFADLFNAVLFEGRQVKVILPEELENESTETSFVAGRKGYGKSFQASRDNIKKRKGCAERDVKLVLLGQEAQEYIHYAMPIRVMGYDYGAYRRQYDRNAKKCKKEKGLSSDEYLSRMKKTDRFAPVITLVIYYGEKPWDGAKSLHEILDIPSEIEKYVNDYKLHLVDPRETQLILHNMDNIDFFHMLSVLRDAKKPAVAVQNEILDYAKEHKVDKSVLMAAVSAARCQVDYGSLEQEGENVMYRVFEELAEKNRQEGREEGREEGRKEGRKEGRVQASIEMGIKFGMPDGEILKMLQENMEIPSSKANEYLERYGKQRIAFARAEGNTADAT